ncbi:PAS domain-containing protein [Anaerobacillus sp. CMMVII]|uniref:sensor histidine kinase n=1 Tax=Anaerobacillus sp. CMMVII TaxID=2755588 RepID=UPI0021B7A3B9|nr:PAS domain-containing sensor histidine kinase [Anaerobacillus sp. CMMVII]MCT8140040.1 PAS domain-containing protein [Anaerobacillus sp. CMMVII]
MFKTLKAKLLTFFLLITLFPLLFLGYISYQSQKYELTKSIEQSLVTFSSELALDVEKLLTERVLDLQHLALNPVVMDPNATTEEITEQFHQFVNVYDIYKDTIFVNPEGIVSVSLIDHVVGNDFTERIWFQASMRGEVYISDIYLSTVLHEPILVMSAPVFDKNGEVIGVISPMFDLNHLWKTFNKFSELEQVAGLGGYAFLMNINGDIIAHPDQSKILTENYLIKNSLTTDHLINKSDQRKIYYNDDSDVVLAYEKIRKLVGFDEEWFVGISVSKTALFAPLQKLLTNYLLIIGLVLLLTKIAIFKLSDFIVRPLASLGEATSDIVIGRPISAKMKNSYEEISRLNHTFLTMAEKLAERDRADKKSTLIIETTDNGVIAINKQTLQITTFNRMCEELFQLNKHEVIGQTIGELSKQSESFHHFVIASKIPTYLNEEANKKFELECNLRQKAYHFFVSVSSLPSLENEEMHDEILLVLNDLTEKRQMERELQRSEQLKVVGEMSAGLAHEIRNPLSIIRGFIQLFRKEEEGSKKGYYDIIINEIDRVNNFITDLLNIANPKPVNDMKEINVVCLLEDLLLLQSSQLYKKGISVVKEFEPPPAVVVDSSKLQQVCINIIQNAVEAMPEGGTLTVATTHLVPENKVCISISDTGLGMDKKTLEKIGTPFYTTKATGTGLGLATSYRIIEEMNGSIAVTSEINKGSTFHIYLKRD